MAVTTLSSVTVFPALSSSDANRVNKRTICEPNTTSSEYDSVFSHLRGKDVPTATKVPLTDWRFRLQASREIIELHLEKRVSQLFAQAVMCFRTGYEFSIGKTIMQGLQENHIPTTNGLVKFAAAHHATIPCLYAKVPNSQQEIVFQYGSGFFNESNATLGVGLAINQADSAIDLKLRNKLIELLNRCSKGELNPQQVTKRFIKVLKKEIRATRDSKDNQEIKGVLKVYANKARDLSYYIKDPESFDRWLGVDMSDPAELPSLKTIECLQEGENVSQKDILKVIRTKVDSLPVEILRDRHLYANENRAPNHFHDLYLHRVISQFTQSERPLIERAIECRFAALTDKVAGFQRIGKTQQLLNQQAGAIDRLVRELRPLVQKASGQHVSPDQLIGLGEGKKVCLRPRIYTLRHRIIQADQHAQSVIGIKLDDLFNEIKGKRAPAHLKPFFHAALLNEMRSLHDRQALCKFLCISPTDVMQQVREIKVSSAAHKVLSNSASLISRLSVEIDAVAREKFITAEMERRLFNKLVNLHNQLNSEKPAKGLGLLLSKRLFELTNVQSHNLLEKLVKNTKQNLDDQLARLTKITSAEARINANKRKITDAAAVFFQETTKLRENTAEFRRNLMFELRKSHGMSHKHFVGLYKEMFPGYAMSDGTRVNLENGNKAITPVITEHLSKIFGVSSSLFYPSHFAEG